MHGRILSATLAAIALAALPQAAGAAHHDSGARANDHPGIEKAVQRQDDRASPIRDHRAQEQRSDRDKSRDARANDHPGIERAVLRRVNRVRERHDLRPLRRHWALERSALRHSRDLVHGTALRHTSANGDEFWTRLVRAGYPRRFRMAENLALMPSCAGSVRTNARRVVRMWMESPSHRENLLDGRLRTIGVSAVSAGSCRTTTFYTADFGG